MNVLTLFLAATSLLLAGAVVPEPEEKIPNIPLGLPAPQLTYKSREDYKTPSGEYTRYIFTITNRQEIAEQYFLPSPDLPPIGLNKRASRTVVTFYDANNRPLQRFVALRSNAHLDGIWFAVHKGQSPSEQVYVEFHDRRLDTKTKSNFAKPGVAIVP